MWTLNTGSFMVRSIPSKRFKILSESQITEIYICQRALNARSKLLVYIYKGRRYRTDHWTMTSADELVRDGWKLEHRYEEKK